MNHNEAMIRAARARQIIEDPMVKEAFKAVEDALKDQWATSADTDDEGRERCFRAILGLRAFKAFFEIAIQHGQVAEYQAKEYRRSGSVVKPAA